MQELYRNIDKNIIPKLPRFNFEGKIVVVQGQFEAQRAVNALMRQTMLGIDTETRPSFKKGIENKVALLQISSEKLCFLFRLHTLGLCKPLVTLLEAEDIQKIGLSLKDDIFRLRKIKPFTPKSFIDLQDYVKRFGIEDMSLQKIFANVFRLRISKNARLSNWEADVLTETQKLYAATDAYACLKLYRHLKKLEGTNAFKLIPPDAEDSSDQETNY